MEEDTINDFSKKVINITNVRTNKDVVYACSEENGLYVSQDDGNTWINYTAHMVSGTLPPTDLMSNCVRDVCVDDDYVYLATSYGVSMAPNSSVLSNEANWYWDWNTSVGGKDGVHRIAAANGLIYAGAKDSGLFILINLTAGVIRQETYPNYRQIKHVNAVYAHPFSVRNRDIKRIYINSKGYFTESKFNMSDDCGLTWCSPYTISPGDVLSDFSAMLLQDKIYVFAACGKSLGSTIYVDSGEGLERHFSQFNSPPPFQVSTIACGGNHIYAGSTNDDANVCIGEVHDMHGNTSWSHFNIADNPSFQDGPDAKKIVAMAASSSGNVAYAVSGNKVLYVSKNSGATWNSITEFNSAKKPVKDLVEEI